jgi:hypothetical protein
MIVMIIEISRVTTSVIIIVVSIMTTPFTINPMIIMPILRLVIAMYSIIIPAAVCTINIVVINIAILEWCVEQSYITTILQSLIRFISITMITPECMLSTGHMIYDCRILYGAIVMEIIHSLYYGIDITPGRY